MRLSAHGIILVAPPGCSHALNVEAFNTDYWKNLARLPPEYRNIAYLDTLWGLRPEPWNAGSGRLPVDPERLANPRGHAGQRNALARGRRPTGVD
jgi:hypothetical protein